MIVAIHGAADTPEQWEPLRPLVDDELLAWAAPRELDVDYRPSCIAARIGDAFAGRASLAGFSWGGSVALRFAALYPERVERLALVHGGHLDFVDLAGYERPASREAVVAEHGLHGALVWGLADEPNREWWPAVAAGDYPVLLVANDGAVADRFAAAVPRAEIVHRTGHEIDYATVASWLTPGLRKLTLTR